MESITSFFRKNIHLLPLRLIYKKPLFILRSIGIWLLYWFTKENRIYYVAFASTFECNFNCTHCYIKSFRNTNRRPLTTGEKIDAIHRCLKDGVIAFEFIGGECLLSSDFPVLVKACKPYKTYISLVSNGYYLTRKKLIELSRLGVDKIGISIDSADEKGHDEFRRQGGLIGAPWRPWDIAGSWVWL